MTTTLFSGGVVRTSAETRPADWLLVDEGRVVGAGGDSDRPASDRVVDLEGAFLGPAFRDGHVHLPTTGLYELGFDFRGERSAAVIAASFKDRARAPGDEPLFGGNFEDPLDEPFAGSDLDAAVGDRPALLARADMHSCIASTALLRRLDLEGVEGVDRAKNGEPTGYLREQAAARAWTWFDRSLSPEQQRAAVLAAVQRAYSKGVAEVHEMFVVEWRGWDSAASFGDTIAEVALEVVVFLGTDDVKRVKGMGLPRIGGDYFLDGSFGSHTAWLSEPYSTPPPGGSSPVGISYRDTDALLELFGEAQEAGLQVGVHAIGDAAIEQAIACWEKVAGERGEEEVRRLGHRIEHFECASDDHIERAARLGLRPSVQPAFDRYWGGKEGLYAGRIGWSRAKHMNRFRSMAAAGLTMAAGSDSTVTPLDPFLQMASLRNHRVASESLDAAAAFELNTVGPARLAGREHLVGTLRPDIQADLAVLDRDPLVSDEDTLLATEVLGTWIAGRRVWPRENAEAA
jgi:predicted amidohydrolase YtcJ